MMVAFSKIVPLRRNLRLVAFEIFSKLYEELLRRVIWFEAASPLDEKKLGL